MLNGEYYSIHPCGDHVYRPYKAPSTQFLWSADARRLYEEETKTDGGVGEAEQEGEPDGLEAELEREEEEDQSGECT